MLGHVAVMYSSLLKEVRASVSDEASAVSPCQRAAPGSKG